MKAGAGHQLALVLSLLGFWLGSTDALRAHVVQQLYADFIQTGDSWEFEVLFDAGYADPEMRANPESPQPLRTWLIGLDDADQSHLCKQAETYLRELLVFRSDGSPIKWQATFPDFLTDPPDYPRLLNEGAYVRISITPRNSDPADGLSVSLAEGMHPDFVVGVAGGDDETFLSLTPGDTQRLLDPGEKIGEPAWSISFIQGFLHVVPKGLDHILFVLGIFLLKREWRTLLSQSLAFTAAHTITLGLAAAGKLSVPESIVEPLIALSISALAVENLLVSEARPWRLGLVFLFGLIHGLGFAGVLSAWIQPGAGFLPTLLCANFGVEVGQVLVLLLAWCLTIKLHRTKSWPGLRHWSCVLLAIVGLWWFVERVVWR